MSDELRLPDDLAACEARLAAQLLPTTAINRDELMYRAGWAACEARLGSATGGPLRLANGSGGVIAVWSLASAATAAALAVVLTLHWQPAEEPQVARRAVEAPPALAAEAAEAQAPAIAQRQVTPATLPEFPSSAGVGLLSMRRQALNSAWEQPTRVITVNGDGPPATKTVRELMQEMLPSEPARSTRIWPWISAPGGESI
jgi:hypothetical protein